MFLVDVLDVRIWLTYHLSLSSPVTGVFPESCSTNLGGEGMRHIACFSTPEMFGQFRSANEIRSSTQFSYMQTAFINGSVSKPCTPVVHIKIAGIYGCSSP